MFAFSLSLLGTFLVRSGVLTSAHAFASDPERGVFILAFLIPVVGSSLVLYTWRAPQIRSVVKLNMMSREGGILINNILLVVTAASVLLGTLYPLFLDAMNLGKISVGPPYFNAIFVPLTIPLAVLVGVVAMSRWKQDSFGRLFAEVKWALIASVTLGVAIPLLMLDEIKWGAPVGITLAFWITFTSLQNLYQRVSKRNNKWQALKSVPRGFYGMTFAHIGVAVFIVGITLTNLYSIEKDVRLAPGETYSISGYDFLFNEVAAKTGPNYQAT